MGFVWIQAQEEEAVLKHLPSEYLHQAAALLNVEACVRKGAYNEMEGHQKQGAIAQTRVQRDLKFQTPKSANAKFSVGQKGSC